MAWLRRHPDEQDILLEPSALPTSERPDVLGRLDAITEPRIGDGLTEVHRHRHHAGPDGPSVVVILVDRRAAAHLRRGVLERKTEHGCLHDLGRGGRSQPGLAPDGRSAWASNSRARSASSRTYSARPTTTTER